tara:strand:+ start:1162 stop:1551 length:390 start_codon:yes stop_codon:yes gene_type:complete
MDNKTLSDFMPKVNTDGEITYGEISTSKSAILTDENVIKVLTKIKDPELDMNIYDLGLIYELSIDNYNNIKIIMTLTTVNCPVADSFPLDVAKKVHELKNVGQVSIKLTFQPPWSKDMMSEDAKLALGF